MRKGYIITNQFAPHFLTFTIVGWVDLFSRRECRDIVIESMKYCQENKGLSVHAYVIMSSHIHVIWSAEENSIDLSSIVRDFKRYTANQIIKWVEDKKESRRDWLKVVFRYYAQFNNRNRKYQIWQQNNMAKELIHPRFTRRILDYIHMNPVVDHLVEKEEDYLYSSARNYLGLGNLKLDVELIEFGAEEGFVLG